MGRHGRGLTRINGKGRAGGDRSGNTREKSGGRGCLRRDSAPSTTSVTPGGNETTDGDTVVTPLPAPAEGGAARLRRLRGGGVWCICLVLTLANLHMAYVSPLVVYIIKESYKLFICLLFTATMKYVTVATRITGSTNS